MVSFFLVYTPLRASDNDLVARSICENQKILLETFLIAQDDLAPFQSTILAKIRSQFSFEKCESQLYPSDSSLSATQKTTLLNSNSESNVSGQWDELTGKKPWLYSINDAFSDHLTLPFQFPCDFSFLSLPEETKKISFQRESLFTQIENHFFLEKFCLQPLENAYATIREMKTILLPPSPPSVVASKEEMGKNWLSEQKTTLKKKILSTLDLLFSDFSDEKITQFLSNSQKEQIQSLQKQESFLKKQKEELIKEIILESLSQTIPEFLTP